MSYLGQDFYYHLIDQWRGDEFIKRLIMSREKAAWLNKILAGTGFRLIRMSR